MPHPNLVVIVPPFEEWVLSDHYSVSPDWVGLGSQRCEIIVIIIVVVIIIILMFMITNFSLLLLLGGSYSGS